jgi:hypothetical protein
MPFVTTFLLDAAVPYTISVIATAVAEPFLRLNVAEHLPFFRLNTFRGQRRFYLPLLHINHQIPSDLGCLIVLY